MYYKLKTYNRHLVSVTAIICFLLFISFKDKGKKFKSQIIMLEEFDKPGKPLSDLGFEWSFVNDMYPNQQK